MSLGQDNIFQEVKAYIGNPRPDAFNQTALRVFAFQYENNPVYRSFCEGRGFTPKNVDSWRKVPVVPTAAFKELDLRCGPSELSFLTSGTSRGTDKRGRHHVMSLDLYRAAIVPNFSAHLLPDGARQKMLILAGSPGTWPQSSLSHMMSVVRKEFGGEDSDYYINGQGLEEDRLISDLRSCIKQNEPVFLLGVTLAFHQLIERCQKDGLGFELPPRSRIMDTGGFKGRKISLSRKILYENYRDRLGVPLNHIVNEYGMTEMGSQFYDNTLRNFHRGVSEPRFKNIPHWVRTCVVNPETLEEVPKGQTGILRHYDLSNCGSVMALQTEDLGRITGGGFEVLGRADGAGARGCSLLVEDLLKTHTIR